MREDTGSSFATIRRDTRVFLLFIRSKFTFVLIALHRAYVHCKYVCRHGTRITRLHTAQCNRFEAVCYTGMA